MKSRKMLITIIMVLCATAAAAAQTDMKARIKVSSGSAADYVVVGEMSKATDGFDNPYDAFAPSVNMNDTYIQTTIAHPEWNQVKADFRSDMRSLAERQEWDVTVYTNLPAGSELTVGLVNKKSSLGAEYTLTAQDQDTGATTDLTTGSCTFTTAATPATKHFLVTAVAAADASGDATPLPTYTISGTILDGNGKGVERARIYLTGNDATSKTRSGSDGKFQFHDVPAGVYTVGAKKVDRDDANVSADAVSVTVNDGDVSVTLQAKKTSKGKRR